MDVCNGYASGFLFPAAALEKGRRLGAPGAGGVIQTFLSILLLLCPLISSPAFALEVPPLTGRMVDLANLLPADVAASLSAELADHERKTGNQIAVLTLPSLEGESLEEFSHRVATTWKLGRKGTDNGVLLLVVPGERRIRIEVGYGLEGVLTDAKSSQIIRREIVPHFKAGDFAAGISAGVKAIVATVEGTYVATHESPQQPSWEIFFIAIVIGAFVGGSIFGGTLKRVGSLLSGLLSFVIALPTGWKLALVAAVLGMLAAAVISALSGPTWSGRKGRGGWNYPDWGGGPGSGSGWGSSDTFSGGGGDFGGGGASGRW